MWFFLFSRHICKTSARIILRHEYHRLFLWSWRSCQSGPWTGDGRVLWCTWPSYSGTKCARVKRSYSKAILYKQILTQMCTQRRTSISVRDNFCAGPHTPFLRENVPRGNTFRPKKKHFTKASKKETLVTILKLMAHCITLYAILCPCSLYFTPSLLDLGHFSQVFKSFQQLVTS